MASFPRHRELPDALLIHGFYEPGVPLAEQRDAVVIGTMSGEHHIRERCGEAWYRHYDGDRLLVCGHLDYLRNGEPLVHAGRVYGLDTGVHLGGRLTALVPPMREIVQVPAREDYWTRLRREYRFLTTGSQCDLDLKWDRLADYAGAAEREGLPPAVRERAERCAAVARECRRLEPEIVIMVTDRCRRMLASLAEEDDGSACRPAEQAARYARLAGDQPAAALLFAARTGKLEIESVRRRAKTPRELEKLATAVGLTARWPDTEE